MKVYLSDLFSWIFKSVQLALTLGSTLGSGSIVPSDGPTLEIHLRVPP